MRDLIRIAGGGVPRESFNVYFVEDEDSVRRAIGRLLKSAGYHASIFESAEEFLDSTAGEGERCLILDIRLPGMTGLDRQEKLASSGAKYSVIFMTAHDHPQW
jgi:FixJ family two-component response regulator